MATEYQIREANSRVTLKPPRELTKAEKRANWWYYHKKEVIVGVIVGLCFLDILANALGIGKTRYDYTIAYVGTTRIDEDTEKALTKHLAEISPDMDGNGKVNVQLVQYISPYTGDSDTLLYAQGAEAQLIADVTECMSYFFLMEDPADVQYKTSALCNLDGSLPADGDFDPEGKYVIWGECPALAEISAALKEEGIEKDFDQLALGRRGFWTEKTCENADACALFWEELTGTGE